MQRWTRPLPAEPDRAILSNVWTTSTCYKPREIERIFQRIERLIFNFPSRPATAHEGINIACMHAQVRHPAEVLHLRVTYFPILEEIDPNVRLRSIEGHVIDTCLCRIG